MSIEIERDGNGYVNVFNRLSKKVTIGLEADIKSWSLGFQISFYQEDTWKYYVGVYFLCFSIFIGIDW